MVIPLGRERAKSRVDGVSDRISTRLGSRGGDDEIVSFAWSPPSPDDYAIFGADQHHFCLLSRIETSTSAPFGMTSAETTDLYANVQNNNNIVWKNISVVDDLPGTSRSTGFTVANYGKKRQEFLLHFKVSREERDLFKWGQVMIDIPYPLAKKLREGESKGIKWVSKTSLLVSNPSGIVGGPINLDPGEVYALNVRFVSNGIATFGARIFNFDVHQIDGGKTIGGVRFTLRTHAATRYEGQDLVTDHLPGPRDGGNWIGKKQKGNCCH